MISFCVPEAILPRPADPRHYLLCSTPDGQCLLLNEPITSPDNTVVDKAILGKRGESLR